MHSIGRFSSLASDLVVQTAQSLVVQALECLRTLQQHLSPFAWRTSNGWDGSYKQLAGYQWKCQCSHCPEVNTVRYTDRFPICSPELRSKEPGPLGATEDHWPLPSGTSCWRPELTAGELSWLDAPLFFLSLRVFSPNWRPLFWSLCIRAVLPRLTMW